MHSVGDIVRVTESYDETLGEDFIGRIGRVVEVCPYQGLGDDPEVGDPMYLVKHPPYMGQPTSIEIYWKEEIVKC